MDDQEKSQLISLAKIQLRLPASTQDALVPKGYLKDLALHKQLYPYDTHFRIVAQPKTGYGKLQCLEIGCHDVVVLGPRADGNDGKKEGIGALAEYRNHILKHPTHKTSRHDRVKAENGSPTNKSQRLIKVEPGSTSNMSRTASTGSSRGVTRLSQPTMKSEPVEALIPRKRLSDSGHANTSANNEDLGASSFKKARLSPTKLPLALVDSNSLEHVDHQTPRADTGQIRAEIEAVQARISTNETLLHRAQTKKRPSKADQTRMSTYQKNIDDLLRRKAELRTFIPNLTTQPTRPAMPPVHHHMNQYGAYGMNLMTSGMNPITYGMHPTHGFSNAYGTMPPMGGFTGSPYLIPGAVAPQTAPQQAVPGVGFQAHNFFAGPSGQNSGSQQRELKGYAPLKIEEDEHKPFVPIQPAQMPQLLKPDPEERKFSISSVQDRKPKPEPDGFPISDDMDLDGFPQIPARFANAIPHIPQAAGEEDNYDENGDYHGRGKDTFVGPRADVDDIDQFLINAGNIEQFEQNATVDQALEKLGLQAIVQPLTNMTVALMPHQAIGVAWMIDREQGPTKGGCLADEMGLGKTVQMIGLMVKNVSKDANCRTTLIVCPMSLLDQWKSEVENKTDGYLKVGVHHASSKMRTKKELLKYDVVLTTFQTMANEWPDYEAEQKKKEKKARKPAGSDDFIVSDSDDEVRNKKTKKQEYGILFQVDVTRMYFYRKLLADGIPQFYRIVLDEAQTIRNRRTRVSRAVTELKSLYRWGLTGTPIINSLVDAYGLVRFLKIRHFYDWSEYNSHIAKPERKNPTLAVTRLQAIFKTFLLRRVKDSELDGKRLIELKKKTVDLVNLEFSKEERDIYVAVETRMQRVFNRYMREGTVLKNYAHVLVLLLRLRQICAHPSLIQEEGKAFISPQEAKMKPEYYSEIHRAKHEMGEEFVEKLKSKFKEVALTRIQAEKESLDAAAESEECPICFDQYTDAVVTGCGHIFCRECITNVLANPVTGADEANAPPVANDRHCPVCRGELTKDKLFIKAAFEPTDKDLFPETDSDVEMDDNVPRTKSNGKAKAKKPHKKLRREEDEVDDLDGSDDDYEDEDDEDDLDDFIVQDDEDEEEKDARRDLKRRRAMTRKAMIVLDSDDEFEETPEEKEVVFGKKRKSDVSPEAIKLLPKFFPSTKMAWMMQHIAKLAEERPDEKTLVISQWTSCLTLVSDYLSEKGIPHVKYQGTMSRPLRDKAVQTFTNNNTVPVMLISLKCGGCGLNLIRANNVISLDLGWSPATEAQAFDRVHRLGQHRDVEIKRLVISDTVEDRILALQDRKQLLADGSLGEGKGQKLGRMTVRELANLFGLDVRGRRLQPRDDD